MSHGTGQKGPGAGNSTSGRAPVRADPVQRDAVRRIRVTVRRYHPLQDATPYDQTYTVELTEPHSVLGVLDRIWSEQDPTLAYHSSCRRGFCSICTLKVNGKAVKTCLELAEGDLKLEAPGRPDKVIRDLAFRW